jgi:hypothetical protein
MNTDQLEQFIGILEYAKKLKLPSPVEKTVFSIGGRGHYENPISDVLSFFFDPNEQHGFGSLILESFFEAIGDVKRSEFMLQYKPMREVSTENQKRIDILLEFPDLVIIIENKIRHWLANDLNHYVEDTRKRYEDKKEVKLVVLTPARVRDKLPDNALNCTYHDFLSVIESKMSRIYMQSPNNKWLFVLRDFILNIRTEIGENKLSLTEAEKLFVINNYENIYKLVDFRIEFIRSIQDDIVNKFVSISNFPLDIGLNEWQKTTALRFYFDKNKDNSNFTVALKPNGKFYIRIYFYSTQYSDELSAEIEKIGFNKTWVEQKTINCFGTKKDQSDDLEYRDMLELVERIAKVISSAYSQS